eukprot:125634-Pleurochrysis_carterae.AAC.1
MRVLIYASDLDRDYAHIDHAPVPAAAIRASAGRPPLPFRTIKVRSLPFMLHLMLDLPVAALPHLVSFRKV